MKKIFLIIIAISIALVFLSFRDVRAEDKNLGTPSLVYLQFKGEGWRIYQFNKIEQKWQVKSSSTGDFINFDYSPSGLSKNAGFRYFLDILKNNDTLNAGYLQYVSTTGTSIDLQKDEIKNGNYSVNLENGNLIQTNSSAAPNGSASPSASVSNTSSSSTNGIFGNTLPEYISNIYNWSIGIAAGLAVIMLIYAGYLYVTSAGNPESINLAKEVIIGAIAGFVFLVLAALILRFVM